MFSFCSLAAVAVPTAKTSNALTKAIARPLALLSFLLVSPHLHPALYNNMSFVRRELSTAQCYFGLLPCNSDSQKKYAFNNYYLFTIDTRAINFAQHVELRNK